MKAVPRQMTDGMSVAEKRELAADLEAAIAEELAAGAAGEPERCPRRGCPRFARKGRATAGARDIGMVNAPRSRIRSFPRPFH